MNNRDLVDVDLYLVCSLSGFEGLAGRRTPEDTRVQVWDQVSVSSSPHLSYCLQTLLFLIHLYSAFTVLQSHAALKAAGSALFWGQTEDVHKRREEKTVCKCFCRKEVIQFIGLCYPPTPPWSINKKSLFALVCYILYP